jgi:hypothetical protein
MTAADERMEHYRSLGEQALLRLYRSGEVIAAMEQGRYALDEDAAPEDRQA